MGRRWYLSETFCRVKDYKSAKPFIEEFFQSVTLLASPDDGIAMNNAEFILGFYFPKMKENGLELYDEVAAELENKCLAVSWKHGDPWREC